MGAAGCQSAFHRRWHGLTQPHVRALAWLLDSPDLLDPDHPYWRGRIATLGQPDAATEAWLHALDADPGPVLEALGGKTYTRLGLYAEKLLAFYFAHRGQLLAHGLQVRAANNGTVGEFDYLLDDGAGGAVHIEFASKYYLLEGVAPHMLDALVGPNLADTLGQKMRKITSKQLELARHPAAQAVLPRPVSRAQALVKGWLFYPRGTVSGLEGLAPDHCRGIWCAADELDRLEGDGFVHLPRLEWLAPWQGADAQRVLDRAALQALTATHFDIPGARPMLLASVRQADGAWREIERAFVVPLDWRARAAQRRVA
ncbi:MAG TPA: DUF1853 family protein [Telluria sp.]|nr:DUF1853 family protein [Telluria sp.]